MRAQKFVHYRQRYRYSEVSSVRSVMCLHSVAGKIGFVNQCHRRNFRTFVSFGAMEIMS
jgi:hypothetical protein